MEVKEKSEGRGRGMTIGLEGNKREREEVRVDKNTKFHIRNEVTKLSFQWVLIYCK
jgi:hypothetical protein